jgi:SAM-dependent methyltransferase
VSASFDGPRSIAINEQLLPHLVCPKSGASLALTAVERDASGRVSTGYLSAAGGSVYPIFRGVPILLPEPWVNQQVIDALRPHLPAGSVPASPSRRDWSFDQEWDAHDEAELTRTWGWTLEERTRMFFLESGVTADECRTLSVLDAGCGNGHLTDSLGPAAGMVIGLDFSLSPISANRRRKNANVFFVIGDILSLPIRPGALDIVYSSGVLHHTGDTRKAFAKVATVVKENGRLFVWLYRKTRSPRQRVLLAVGDNIRKFVHVLPPPLRGWVARAWAGAIFAALKVMKSKRNPTYREVLVSAYDLLTPKHVTFHAPTEVAEWYFENGYGAPTLTHWDNPNGFGMVAVRQALADTPGVNFGLPSATSRYGI